MNNVDPINKLPPEFYRIYPLRGGFYSTFCQVATCSYVRYARLGGGQESKNAICILNMNMINDKVTITAI